MNLVPLLRASIWPGLLLLASVAVAAPAGGPEPGGKISPASQPALSDAQLGVLVGQLNHQAYRVRESATDQLARLDFGQVDRLVPLYKSAIGPEQKMRLRQAVRRIFFAAKRSGKAPEGFIGVGHVQMIQTILGVERSVVLINNVVAGSPAAQAGLRAGDVVTDLNGQPLDDRASQAFADQVRRFKPGEQVKLSIRRDDKKLEVTVTLGDRSKFGLADDLAAWSNEFSDFWRKRFDPNDLTMAEPGAGGIIILGPEDINGFGQ